MKISAKRREAAAAVHTGGKAKFPVDSVHTATSALKLINHAKPALTPDQKAAVRRKAAKYVGSAKVAANKKAAG